MDYSNTAIRWLVHWPLIVGCYIWYIEEGPGQVAAPPSPLLAVPNVTACPSTASVPTSYYLMWHYNCLLDSKGLRMLLLLYSVGGIFSRVNLWAIISWVVVSLNRVLGCKKSGIGSHLGWVCMCYGRSLTAGGQGKVWGLGSSWTTWRTACHSDRSASCVTSLHNI